MYVFISVSIPNKFIQLDLENYNYLLILLIDYLNVQIHVLQYVYFISLRIK